MTDPYGTALRSMDDPSGSRSWYARSEGGTSRSLGEVPHLVITPFWIGLGLLAARFLPAAARPAVVGRSSGRTAGTGRAAVRPRGRSRPGEPSLLPRDYGRNLLLVDLGVLVLTAFWAAVAMLRARPAPAHEQRR